MVQDREVHVDTTEARAGSTSGTVRRVLVFGLILGIIALSAIWITGALTTQEATEQDATVSQSIADGQAATGDDTDGLVDENFDRFAPADEAEARQDADVSATRTVTN